MKNVKLTDLISVDALQQVQDGFSKYTGMAALTTDADGVPVTKGSGFTVFCTELTRKSKIGYKKCEACDKNGALATLEKKHATVYSCHAGLIDYAAPIMVDDIFLGSFVGGQVRTHEVDEEEFRKTAIQYGIDPETYIKAAKSTKCLTQEKIERAAIFLEEIAKSLSSIAYKSYLSIKKSKKLEEAAKSQTDFMMNSCEDLDNSLANWFNIIENKIKSTNNTEVKTLLTEMKEDGEQVRTQIQDTVDFIRMTGKKVSLVESLYRIPSFIKEVKLAIEKSGMDKKIPITVNTGELISEEMYGDSGKICQILNKTFRSLLENKEKGEIIMTISTKKIAYTTFFVASILETESERSQKDIDFDFKNFDDDDLLEINSNSDRVSTYIGYMMHKLSGKITTEKKDCNFFIELTIPQISI